MNDDTNQVLTQAYELIEAEELGDAKRLLEPLVNREKDNADAWWLYAHAVTDTETARTALQNVLRLDPSYPEAADLLKTLEATISPSPLRPIARLDVQQRSPTALPDLPATLPERVDEEWEFEGTGEGKKPSRRFPASRQLALLIPLLVIVIVGVLLVILNSANPPQIAILSPTPDTFTDVPTLSAANFTPLPLDTVVPSNATEEATSTVATLPVIQNTPVNTSAPIVTVEQLPTGGATTTGDAYQAVYDALGNFTIPRNAVEVTQTSLGNTLLVSICTLAGPELRAALPEAMRAIASASSTLGSDVDAVGARMINCGNNTTLLEIAVPRADAIAYANGELDDRAFQALWRSQ